MLTVCILLDKIWSGVVYCSVLSSKTIFIQTKTKDALFLTIRPKFHFQRFEIQR